MAYQAAFKQSIEEPEAFWKEQAEKIAWFHFPDKILYRDQEQLHRWYGGGTLNTSWLCLDHQVAAGRGAQVAVFYDSPVTGVKKAITYAALLDEVSRFAGVLQGFGLNKGDRVVIYMPMIPETIVAMLACARLGAVHSVVFGGFAPRELAIRIDDAQPKLLITATGGVEISKVIEYMPIVDQAWSAAVHRPEACIVLNRPMAKAQLTEGRDYDWHTLMADAIPADYTAVEATDPLYILYTSGTTGKPKGVVRDNGGHAVALRFAMENIYGVKPGDVFWAASDLGWVVGHSFILYGPLLYGCSTVLFEGKPIKTPDAGAFWRIIEEYRVKVLFTAPTAIRAIKKEDPEGSLSKAYDLSSLQYLFLAGERCDIATLHWAEQLLQKPVIDHWWQTESGWPMLANSVGMGQLPVKPGSVTKPVCGYDIQIIDAAGKRLPAGEEGIVVIKLPLPPGNLPNLWRDTARFKQSYLDPYPGYFFSGDGGYIDEDGYVYITGRIDDIINVAGHRLSTAAMEEVVASHPAVAECAVIGVQDHMKGEVPLGFVVIKAGITIDEEQLEKELVALVREKVGPVAFFKQAVMVKRLPKTRSGKILRKIMRNMADGHTYAMPSTIEDPSVLPELADTMKDHGVG
jgi:acyl-coenzyme A synthetase/AMP-(fatty) acid ligase